MFTILERMQIKTYQMARTTKFVIVLLVLGFLWCNEIPEIGTNGKLPPGLNVELLPYENMASQVHRGWPFSFYSSYVLGGKAHVQYFTYSLGWNLFLLLACLSAVIIFLEAAKYFITKYLK